MNKSLDRKYKESEEGKLKKNGINKVSEAKREK